MIAYLSDLPINGYSEIYYLAIILSSCFYAIISIFYLRKNIKFFVNISDKLINWFIFFFVLSTTLIFYFTISPSYSHQYSFFLFNLLFYKVIQLKNTPNFKLYFLVGILFGTILIVRPTNITYIVALFLIFESIKELKLFLIQTIKLKNLTTLFLGFSIPIFVILSVWKWQTGNWIVWGYSGEGFNFSSPHILDHIFSFRIGLFIHSTIILLAFLGIYIMHKHSPFKAYVWSIYTFINLYIISSWWCWDYASSFGNRAYTEHLFILIILLLFGLKQYKKLIIICLVFTSILNSYRYYQFRSEILTVQRFTANTYFKSLTAWNPKNNNRFQFTEFTKPFGDLIKIDTLKNQAHEYSIESNAEFHLTTNFPLNKPRENKSFYYAIELDKKIQQAPLQDFLLVIDAKSNDMQFRYYNTFELHSDRFEGVNSWKNLKFTGIIDDNLHKADTLSIYFWNLGKQNLSIKNLKITLETYEY